jgi:hypothetical protein
MVYKLCRDNTLVLNLLIMQYDRLYNTFVMQCIIYEACDHDEDHYRQHTSSKCCRLCYTVYDYHHLSSTE